jgi:YVTN family beta-propeller protein
MRKTILAVLAAPILSLAACGEPAKQEAAVSAAPPSFRIFVTNETSNDLTVIDGATNQVISTIPVGKRPRGARLSPDGKFLFIALSGSPLAPPGIDEKTLPPPDKTADGIGVLDLATNKIVRTITGVSDPEQLAVHASGKIYVASEDTGQAVVLDGKTGATLTKFAVGGEPEGVNVSPDGRWIYMTSEEDAQVAVIDTATDKLVKAVKVGLRPRSTAFLPDGSRAFVPGEGDRSIHVINTANQTVLQTVKIPGPATDTVLPMDLVSSPDGKRLYLSTGRGGSVIVLDSASLTVVGQVKVGQRPWGIALSPDGRFLYSANGPSNDVSVVDTQTLSIVATVKTGDRPWGVTIAP